MARSLIALLFLISGGCAVDQAVPTPGPGSGPASPSAAPATIDLDAPLIGFPPCSEPPASAVDLPEGLALPPGASLATSREEPPLTYVEGYLPLTPIQVRVFYERSDLMVILSEDEVYESELLVTDGVHRTFIKTLARCELGSDFVAVVAPETEGEQVPVPSGPSDGRSAAASATTWIR